MVLVNMYGEIALHYLNGHAVLCQAFYQKFLPTCLISGFVKKKPYALYEWIPRSNSPLKIALYSPLILGCHF